jgi:hypothetical protein
MKITHIQNPISFKSGYPTFQSSGHLSFKGHPVPRYNPVYENTNPFYRPYPGILPTGKGGILDKLA